MKQLYYEHSNEEKIEGFVKEDLYLEGYKHNPQLEFIEFLYNFLIDYNIEYDTFKDGVLYCNKSKHRSLGDITNISRTYYPNITIEEVKEALLDFGDDLVGHYCGHINKRIYELTDKYCFWNQASIGKKDEYGNIILYRSENKHKKNNEKCF